MKNIQKRWVSSFAVIAGLALIAVSEYGSRRDIAGGNYCTDPAMWPTYTLIFGFAILLCGLAYSFRLASYSKKASVAISIGVSLVIFVIVLSYSAPDTFWLCYEF